MNFVIGSGPSGVAAATALLHQGRQVTMLDAGIELEADRRALVAQMRELAPQQWTPAQLRTIKEGAEPSVKGVLLKMLYGSDFPYREVDRFTPLVKAPGVEMSPSLGRGGLSNTWGAAVLPYRADDIRGWPITIADLAEHYRAVLAFMPVAARVDDLAAMFPLYTARPGQLEPSSQAAGFLADMAKHRQPLTAAGIHFGTSRLAVNSMRENGQPSCQYCRMCMYGCPYELIYNSAMSVASLLENPRFAYVGNVVVQRVREPGNSILIEAVDRLSGQPLRYEGSRVFLACGPLGSTRILLESLDAYERPVDLLDSQYFLATLLRYRKLAAVDEEALHTLSQVFLEILDAEISIPTVHLQVYTYNELYLGAMRNTLGMFYPLLQKIAQEMAQRMLIVQGFLHSDVSPRIRVTLRAPDAAHPRGMLHLAPGPGPADRRQIVSRLIKKLGRCRKYLRAIPLAPLVQYAPAGRSFHSGGAFPMRTNPGPFESDTLGRPHGLSRIHAVDSTVFPSIPATTITLSVMANAHRIASAAAAL